MCFSQFLIIIILFISFYEHVFPQAYMILSYLHILKSKTKKMCFCAQIYQIDQFKFTKFMNYIT